MATRAALAMPRRKGRAGAVDAARQSLAVNDPAAGRPLTSADRPWSSRPASGARWRSGCPRCQVC